MATSRFPVVAAVPIGVQVLGQNGCMVVASRLQYPRRRLGAEGGAG